jgi:methenyltetrahydromethanopterin cyclohydrolase
MSKKLMRRTLFPLAAVGAFAGVGADPANAANVEADNPGIIIRISRQDNGWQVLVPDFEAMHGSWKPGQFLPNMWMPLAEYLEMIDQVFSVDGT